MIRSYRYYFTRYIEVGFPILLTSLTPILMASADNAMVGYLSETVRAAAAFSNSITAIPFLLFIGASSILMPLVAGAVVENNYEKVTRALMYSMVVNLFLGFFCVLVLSVIFFFLDRMGQASEVVSLVRGGYFQIIVLSIIPNSISQPLKRFLDGLGWRFTNMGLSFLSALTNICINYLLIGGNFGFPALGLNGAGLATLFARVMIMCIYIGIAFYFRRKGYLTSLSGGWDSKQFKKMLSLSLPAGLELAVKMGYLCLITVMIGWLGVVEQSSASILFDIERMGLMLPVAIGASASILLAEEWKKGNKEGIREVRRSGYLLALLLMCFVGVIMYYLLPWLLNNFYHPRWAVKELASSLVLVAISFQIADGLTFIGTGALRGLRDTLVPFFVTTVVSFVIGSPLSYLLAFKMGWGLYGIFQGLIIGLFCTAILLYARFSQRVKSLGL